MTTLVRPVAANGNKGRPFERLEVIDDFVPYSAPLNMAIDEILLKNLVETPVLRIYRWTAPTVSFGYFEPCASIFAVYPRWQLVRRWTGGGVVEHGRDTTYSLLVPRSHPFSRRPVEETYQLIHRAAALALAQVGWGAVMLSSQQNPPVQKVSHVCFANPVRHDLMFEGRKVAGAAQRRTRDGLLHQGSIQGPVGMDGNEPADILGAFISEALCNTQQARTLSAQEMTAAQGLAVAKYGTEAWLRRF